MHSLALATLALGAAAGWIWKRCHVAWQDVRSALGRLKGAREIRRRETVVTAVVIVIAVLVVRTLAMG